MWWWSNSNWTSWDDFWLRFGETRGVTAVLLTVNFFYCWHAFGYLQISLIQTWYDDRDTIVLSILILVRLILDSWSQECEKARTSALVLSHSIWMEFCLLLRLVCVLSLTLALVCPFSIQRRELLVWFYQKKTWTLVCWPISFKLDMMIETTKLYILI